MTSANDDLYKEKLPNVRSTLGRTGRRVCRPETLRNKFPILDWLPTYKLPSYLIKDAIAGFTVGLTTIPQAIAYGVVAGLEPQYGLYSSFMGCFVYIIFGSCKDVTIATTAIMALMVNQYAKISPELAVLITFMAGIVILVLGLLNLGVLVRFISIPVITGFTMAAAITIGSAQINNLFGMKSPSSELIAAWRHFFTHLASIRVNDAVLGVLTLVFLLGMKEVKRCPYGNKTFWKYFGLSRNALAVIIGTCLAYLLSRDGEQPFNITGNITGGLPPFRLPHFSIEADGRVLPFDELLRIVGTSMASIPLVSILEVVAISKAFSKGKIVDASQEMIALGMCNIMGSFVSALPATGSFTRTAVNNASGVKTTLGGAVTGGLVLMALAFLTQTFYYIPKTTLAAIIIAAMISLVEPQRIADMWKSKRFDLWPFLATVLPCTFWNLEYGILCGVAANMLFILYASARPRMHLTVETIGGHEVGVVDVQQKLDYASAEYVKEKIIKFAVRQRDNIRLIVLRGDSITSLDYTVAANIVSMKGDLDVLACELLCWRWSVSAAGVVCRLNRELSGMFRFDASLEDVVAAHYEKHASSESTSTVCLL